MDKKDRIRLIRERHRKLILEPRGQKEYPVLDSWDDEPFFDDEELAGKYAQTGSDTDDE